MCEWKNPFNAFNSMKVLCWRDRFEAIMEGKIPPPVSVTIDSTNICNLKCKFCHYAEFRKEKQKTVSEEDLMWIADTVPQLGAISVCYAGGGEPLLHDASGRFLKKLAIHGINIGLITNGIHLNKFMDELLKYCRWVGISVDASTPAIYKELKGSQEGDFYKVINNINTLARNRKNRRPSIGFKFLIHPDNYHSLLDAVKLAKSIGVDDFHARPCYNPGMVWYKDMVDEVLKQIKDAQRMFEDDNFRIFGVTHKFDESFSKKVVDKCEVTPIAGLTFAADGYCYHCCDLRGVDMGKLCEWRDILSIWDSDKHREILNKLDPKKCPHRCTFNSYQEILEKVFKQDLMCYKFP